MNKYTNKIFIKVKLDYTLWIYLHTQLHKPRLMQFIYIRIDIDQPARYENLNVEEHK